MQPAAPSVGRFEEDCPSCAGATAAAAYGVTVRSPGAGSTTYGKTVGAQSLEEESSLQRRIASFSPPADAVAASSRSARTHAISLSVTARQAER